MPEPRSRLPALFLGHGSPLNALQTNAWTRGWAALGDTLERPRAVLAARVQRLLAPLPVAADHEWGLDHGTWSVLCHLFPQANVPVIQLSIDATRPPSFHYGLGARLQPLREEGILLLGSGDVVHNLQTYVQGRQRQEPYDWAVRFEARVREGLTSGEHAPLIDYAALGRDALLAVPTPEHYLPLLYMLGASVPGEAVSFPVEGIDGGSVSMWPCSSAADRAQGAVGVRSDCSSSAGLNTRPSRNT